MPPIDAEALSSGLPFPLVGVQAFRNEPTRRFLSFWLSWIVLHVPDAAEDRREIAALPMFAKRIPLDIDASSRCCPVAPAA